MLGLGSILFEAHAAYAHEHLCCIPGQGWLKDGGRFDMQFMKGMLGSSVVTPLLSWDALKRMTVLTPSSPCDNVLLEWTLALELHGCLGIKVMPLLVGPMIEAADGLALKTGLCMHPPGPRTRWGEHDSWWADTLFDSLSTKELCAFQDKGWLKQACPELAERIRQKDAPDWSIQGGMKHGTSPRTGSSGGEPGATD